MQEFHAVFYDLVMNQAGHDALKDVKEGRLRLQPETG